MTITNERLTELIELAGKATPGPWKANGGTVSASKYRWMLTGGMAEGAADAAVVAAFIVSARNAAGEMAAELLEARNEIQHLKDWRNDPATMSETMMSAMNAASQEVVHALRAEVAALRKAAEWIPVAERLPDISGMYLVCAIYSLMDDTGYLEKPTKHFEEWYFSGIGWGGLYDHNAENFAEFNITHWRPLPDPPEVSE